MIPDTQNVFAAYVQPTKMSSQSATFPTHSNTCGLLEKTLTAKQLTAPYQPFHVNCSNKEKTRQHAETRSHVQNLQATHTFLFCFWQVVLWKRVLWRFVTMAILLSTYFFTKKSLLFKNPRSARNDDNASRTSLFKVPRVDTSLTQYLTSQRLRLCFCSKKAVSIQFAFLACAERTL